MTSKWKIDDYVRFLGIYQNYEILYNMNHPDYSNKQVKNAALMQLLQDVNDCGIEMDKRKLMAKIKTIKDLVRFEVSKINRSREAVTEELYYPRLEWFPAAEFLSEHFSQRKPSNNLGVSVDVITHAGESDLDETTGYFYDTTPEGNSSQMPILHSIQQNGIASNLSSSKCSVTTTSDYSLARSRRRDDHHFLNEAKKEIAILREELRKTDENVAFGEYVGIELQKMSPLEQATMRRDITNLITNFLIEKRTKTE